MTSKTKHKLNSIIYISESSVLIVFVIMFVAFFIGESISADDSKQREATEQPKAPAEISSEEKAPTEDAKEDLPQIKDAPEEETSSLKEETVQADAPGTKTKVSESQEEILHEATKPEEKFLEEEEEAPDTKPLHDSDATERRPTPTETLVDEVIDPTPETLEQPELHHTSDEPEISTDEAPVEQMRIAPESEEMEVAPIVINEIQVGGHGSGKSKDEFIELYNQTDRHIDLSDFALKKCSKSCSKWDSLVSKNALQGSLLPYGYFLIAHPSYQEHIGTDLPYSSASYSVANNNSVALFSNEEIVDLVGFGDATQFEDAPASNPSAGKSISRKKSASIAQDTNDNSKDFTVTTPTPQSSGDNSPHDDTVEDSPPIDYKALGIRINEVYPEPKKDEDEDEYIELYNNSDSPIDLSGWIIADQAKVIHTKPKSNAYVLPQKDIAPHSFVIIYKKDSRIALNNDDDAVYLFAPNKERTLVSHMAYTKAPKGRSWNVSHKGGYWEEPTPRASNNANPLTKDYPIVHINEIFPDPSTNTPKTEFIELYNPSKDPVTLRDWVIRDASQSGRYTFTDEVIPAKSYFVIDRTSFKFALNNTGGETVSLIAPNARTIATISYNNSRKGRSLNTHPEQWYWTKPTPGKKNADNPLAKHYPHITINEILPNPASDESTDEYIELYNPSDKTVSLGGWALSDSSKTGLYVFPEQIRIKARTYYTIYRKDYSFALNNSGGEAVSLLAPNTKVMSSVYYESAREGVSYNFTGSEWRWSKHLTPWRANIFNSLPKITHFKVDKRAYRDVYVNFQVKADDADREELKVRWSFGDERKSYKWKTRHKYTKAGKYRASVRIQDGSEEVTKDFVVDVTKYPRHKVNITEILPNPAGKDTEGEYILVQNDSNKKVRLHGWSVATGATKKKLINHPIREKITVRSQESERIGRAHAAITLPNKGGVVELRRPDGSVADRVTYQSENTIKDDVLFAKQGGIWTWISPFTDATMSADNISHDQANAIIARALANEQGLQNLGSSGVILGAQTDNSPRDALSISSHQSIFEKILSFFTIILHKILLLLS